MKVVTVEAPAHWASYLINGDDSGIEPEDRAAADRWVAELGHGEPSGCDSAGIGYFAGCQCDLEAYTFLIDS